MSTSEQDKALMGGEEVNTEEKIAGNGVAGPSADAVAAGSEGADQDAAMTDKPPQAVPAEQETSDEPTKDEISVSVMDANVSVIAPSIGEAPSVAVTVAPSKSLGKMGKKSSRTTSPVSAEGIAASTSSQAISAANIAAAAQMAASLQLNGLLSLLTQSSHPSSGIGTAAADPTVLHTTSASSLSSWQLPSADQVRQAALKALQDCPPFVHLSKVDSAPQLKILDDRLTLKGGMRGYRMSRATHGVAHGQYYYEILVLPPPSVSEIAASLPPNARLGPTLQSQIQQALEYEKRQQNNASAFAPPENSAKELLDSSTATTEEGRGRKRKADAVEDDKPPQVGGHLRVGWSMRTGDLQAPVGYDKWSYGFRNISGSRIHESRREDSWGGESWGPGDVIGCAIVLKESQGASNSAATSTGNNAAQNNHIRFFKNGEAMGEFVIKKGKRGGGAAFENIHEGTYYPAISSYLGGSVKVNFGPYFVYPPRKLPHGIGKLQPVSSLQAPPLSKQEILSRLKPSMFSRAGKTEITPEKMLQAFKDAILAETEVLSEAHQQHRRKHLQEVLASRQERNLSVADVQQEIDEMSKAEDGQIANAVEQVLNKDTIASNMEYRE